MTFVDVKNMIEGFDLPYDYYQFPEPGQEPPFICYYYTGSDDLSADNINYAKIRELVIELYTDIKDFELEETIENALTAADLYYSKDETYIGSERMYMVSYSVSLSITAEE